MTQPLGAIERAGRHLNDADDLVTQLNGLARLVLALPVIAILFGVLGAVTADSNERNEVAVLVPFLLASLFSAAVVWGILRALATLIQLRVDQVMVEGEMPDED